MKKAILMISLGMASHLHAMNDEDISTLTSQFLINHQGELPHDYVPFHSHGVSDGPDAIVAKCAVIEKLIKDNNMERVKLGTVYVQLWNSNNDHQNETTNTTPRGYSLYRKRFIEENDRPFTGKEVDEITTIFKTVKCQATNIVFGENEVYVYPTVVGDHFTFSWSELFTPIDETPRFTADATPILNEKKQYLLTYIFDCLKAYKKSNPHEKGPTECKVPFLKIDGEVSIPGHQDNIAKPFWWQLCSPELYSQEQRAEAWKDWRTYSAMIESLSNQDI